MHEVAHRDVWELRKGARHLVYQAGGEAQRCEIESLAYVVTVVRESIKPVANSEYRRRIDRKQVVELSAIHPTKQTPLVRTR